jgi:hypothetical protein
MSMPLSGKATVDALADQWAKLFAIYLYREGIKEIIISSPDIKAICDDTTEPTIVVQELADGLHVKILPITEALALAKQNKGGFGKS